MTYSTKRVKHWFYCTNRNLVNPKQGDGKGKGKVIDLRQARKYSIPRHKAYQKIFWKPKLKAIVEKAFSAEDNLAKPEGREVEHQIAFQNRFCAEMYEKESDDVKKEVEDYIEKLRESSLTPSLDKDESERAE